jgi:heme/copper-type cytochrome/quinol oxidase subunit 2
MINLAFVFSTTVLVTTIATLVLAIAAYFAYKLREWRKPKLSGGEKTTIDASFEPIFLKRHLLNDIAPDEHVDHA